MWSFLLIIHYKSKLGRNYEYHWKKIISILILERSLVVVENFFLVNKIHYWNQFYGLRKCRLWLILECEKCIYTLFLYKRRRKWKIIRRKKYLYCFKNHFKKFQKYFDNILSSIMCYFICTFEAMKIIKKPF